jgi:transcriptional regulator with XRE-family HTH domain
MKNKRTTISKFLKEQRGFRGWSQRELARQLNCPQATVQLWEAEKNHPDLLNMEKIAALFSMPVSELFKVLESGQDAKKCGIREIIDAIQDMPTSEIIEINSAIAQRLVQVS